MEERVRKATRLALAVLGVAVLALVVWVELLPARQGRAERLALRAALARAEDDSARRPQLAADIAALDAALGRRSARIPDAARLDDFVAAAGGAARTHGVRIMRLQPGDQRPGTDADVQPVRVTVQGDFERIHAWMVALEEGPRLVRIETLKAHSVPGEGVQAELQVGLYAARTRPGG